MRIKFIVCLIFKFMFFHPWFFCSFSPLLFNLFPRFPSLQCWLVVSLVSHIFPSLDSLTFYSLCFMTFFCYSVVPLSFPDYHDISLNDLYVSYVTLPFVPLCLPHLVHSYLASTSFHLLASSPQGPHSLHCSLAPLPLIGYFFPSSVA